MSRGLLRLTGYLGLAWGILALLAYLLAFAVATRALAASGTAAVQVLVPLATAAFVAMMFFIGAVLRNPLGKAAAYAAMGAALVSLILQFVRVGGGGVAIVVTVVLGLAMIAAGVFALLQGGSLAWRAFAILFVIAGALNALKAIVIGEIVYPFIACAAGIVLFVAMSAAAKQTA
ncbi:MAG TPA: hypothetical protein VIF14_09300 [Alphaproteobacteria bacterium]|jgi:hypothetical protein